ncbi:MAG: hypothetical protein Q8O36_07130 [Candidatus Omnitrophota bacterium]|nr:hypothetical protein [Candidatus Omnitrophota bacterium]
MKKLIAVTIALLVLVGVTNVLYAEFKRFNVYTDKTARDNHYIASGWMGDYGDLKLDLACKDAPHSGVSCIKVTYSGEQKQGAGWTGIYWQNPANNWGTKPGGYDLSGASKLVFWVKGTKGGEILSEVKIGGITGEYSDSDSASIGPITLTKEWKEYKIDLKGKDLSYISGGFCWSASAADNPEGFTIYFDDIYYE